MPQRAEIARSLAAPARQWAGEPPAVQPGQREQRGGHSEREQRGGHSEREPGVAALAARL